MPSTINSNSETVIVEDNQLQAYEGVNLVGKGYRDPNRNWGHIFNENFLNLASKIKNIISGTYTKTQTDEAIDDRINFLIGSAPQNLDTIYEIAMKLNENDGALAQLLALIDSKVSIPIGSVTAFAGSVAPVNFMFCDGSLISRSVYASLFSAIGTSFGVGDGSTTFNLPDSRGEFIRGLDGGRGVDSSRVLGSSQSDSFKSHTHDFRGAVSGDGTYSYLRTSSVNAYPVYKNDGAIGFTGSSETRPRNIALNYIIRVS